MNRSELRLAVQTLLNDVIEQCFKHLIHHPQESDELNRIIRDCSKEISYLTIKIDAHSFQPKTPEIAEHYVGVSKEVHQKSLELMSRLQNVKQRKSNVADE